MVKQRLLKNYAEKFGLKVLVETGTYMGETVSALEGDFAEIYSIELDDRLYERAKRKFRNHRNVHVVHGDSAIELPLLISGIDQPCLFWLDAHKCGTSARAAQDTPIEKELQCLIRRTYLNDVILIDDAANFNGRHDYPTIDDISKTVLESGKGWTVEVKHDIIRIHMTDPISEMWR